MIDRSTKEYDMIMRWSRVFLLGKSFTTFSGTTNARALLFPMEKVFESYVSQQLRKVMAGTGWEISTQDKGCYLFDSPKQFALRPDIVIIRDDGSKIIIDTKWKSLTDKPRINYGISQADMYQMYAYAKNIIHQKSGSYIRRMQRCVGVMILCSAVMMALMYRSFWWMWLISGRA